MSYNQLAKNTKKIISDNANKYSKANYKQITLKLRPDVVDKFEAMCKDAGISRAEMFRRLINNNNA